MLQKIEFLFSNMREAIPSAISSYFYYGFTASCIIRESLSGYFATEMANYSAVSRGGHGDLRCCGVDVFLMR